VSDKDNSKAEKDLESALEHRGQERFVLRLYVAGTTPKSAHAIANLKKICEEELHGRYDLEVIDMYQQPEAANGDQVLAVPTLIKQLPAPLRKMIGDLSDRDKVIVGLGIKPKDQ
jgi:circadian clock protein KaiB